MDNSTHLSASRKLARAALPALSSQLSADAIDRARRIRLLVFDVDGVLTDGTIWFFPSRGKTSSNTSSSADPFALLPPGTAIPAGAMVEVKGFNAHDGIGVTLARRAGLKTGIITKRMSESLALRARDLRIDYIRQGVERKLGAFNDILRESGLSAEQACCMGDDVIDLPMLDNCGFAAAPLDARHEVLQHAHFVALHAGGRGAARDLIEFILKQQGVWADLVRDFVAEREGMPLTGPSGAPRPPRKSRLR